MNFDKCLGKNNKYISNTTHWYGHISTPVSQHSICHHCYTKLCEINKHVGYYHFIPINNNITCDSDTLEALQNIYNNYKITFLSPSNTPYTKTNEIIINNITPIEITEEKTNYFIEIKQLNKATFNTNNRYFKADIFIDGKQIVLENPNIYHNNSITVNKYYPFSDKYFTFSNSIYNHSNNVNITITSYIKRNTYTYYRPVYVKDFSFTTTFQLKYINRKARVKNYLELFHKNEINKYNRHMNTFNIIPKGQKLNTRADNIWNPSIPPFIPRSQNININNTPNTNINNTTIPNVNTNTNTTSATQHTNNTSFIPQSHSVYTIPDTTSNANNINNNTNTTQYTPFTPPFNTNNIFDEIKSPFLYDDTLYGNIAETFDKTNLDDFIKIFSTKKSPNIIDDYIDLTPLK